MPSGGARTGSGRIPKPTRLKALHGSVKGKRQLTVEPEADLGAPSKPEWFAAIADEAWTDLVEMLDGQMHILTVADRFALEMLVNVYQEWRIASERVETDGSVLEFYTEHGSKLMPHPAVAQRSDSFRRLHAMIQEFGLTPAARTRLKGPQKKREETDPLEALMERRSARRGA